MSYKLRKAVLEQMGGVETFQKWADNHGADESAPGFSPGIEMEKFFDDHRVTILKALKDQVAEVAAQDLTDMVLDFSYWRNVALPRHMDVAATLLGQDSECAWGPDIKTVFVWHALDYVKNVESPYKITRR